MTAPGKHLEFSGGPAFKRRVAGMPELEGAVVGFLKSHPPAALDAHGVSAFELDVDGQIYGIVSRRVGQRIYLLGIFSLPGELKAFERRSAHLRTLYEDLEGSGS